MRILKLGLCGFLVLGVLAGCDKLPWNSESSKAAGTANSQEPAGEKLGSVSDFEGVVGLLFSSSEAQERPIPPLELFVRKGRVRLDAPLDAEQEKHLGGKVYLLLDIADKRASAVLDGRKQVVVIDLDKAGEELESLPFAQGASKRAQAEKPPKVEKTGKRDKVAGRDCDEWQITPAEKDSGKVLACVAKEGGSWFRLPAAAFPKDYAWLAELADGQHYPLRFIHLDERGKESGKLEVTKLEKRALKPELFEVPPGYEVLDLQRATQQLMAQMASGRLLPGGAGEGRPGKNPFGVPPGAKLPEGFKLPEGVKLPEGFKLPEGVKLPEGFKLPQGLPPAGATSTAPPAAAPKP
jgi:hypothetical protein